ncbi:MAG TPA: group I intron-associated PD-(D/E)XK endonuclease [Thermoleophilaceae bacterium]|nr:group I intron-associated PD-(D/E)XK endonuclease [Thermoleophilaceae bacterium]
MDGGEIIRRLRTRVPSRHTVDVGLQTEAVITSELLRRGIRVLLPCGFNHRYDLVLDLDGDFVRVQCKTGRLRRGVVHFNSESVRSNSKAALRRAYDGEAEIFVVYCQETDEIYAVPVADAPKRGVTLRVEPTANSQAEGVRWARDYILPA